MQQTMLPLQVHIMTAVPPWLFLCVPQLVQPRAALHRVPAPHRRAHTYTRMPGRVQRRDLAQTVQLMPSIQQRAMHHLPPFPMPV